jgi:integrase
VPMIRFQLSRSSTKAIPSRTATTGRPAGRPHPEQKVWSPQELGAFLDHVRDDRLYALWLLVATTGMRRGELAGLRWVDIDFDHATVSPTIPRVVVDHQVQDSAPKTERARRRLALDPVTLAALVAQRKLQAEDRHTVGRHYRDHGYVFAWPDGRPLHPENITSWFEQHTRAAGLPRIRHDVRHSSATAALRAGISAKVIGERLGHASVAFTLQTTATSSPAWTGRRRRPSPTSSSPACRRGPEPWSRTPPLTTARRATHP